MVEVRVEMVVGEGVGVKMVVLEMVVVEMVVVEMVVVKVVILEVVAGVVVVLCQSCILLAVIWGSFAEVRLGRGLCGGGGLVSVLLQ